MQFHGSLIAGIIAANANNSLGIAGVDWNCKIMPLRCIGKYGGVLSDIIEALKYSAGIMNVSGTLPDTPAKIINLCIGSREYSRSLEDILTEINIKKIIVVCAAGNENTGDSFYPAAYTSTIAVSAVDYSDNKAYYSNYGSYIDFCAPGGNMSAEINGDNFADGILSVSAETSDSSSMFQSIEGTSMAAAHITGVCALMLAIDSSLTPAAVKNILASTSIDLGLAGKDQYFGFGLINAERALLQISYNLNTPPSLFVPSTTAYINLPNDSSIIKLYNSGNMPLQLNSITKSDNIISTNIINNFEPYSLKISIDTTMLPVMFDTITKNIWISSNGGNETLSIIIHSNKNPVIFNESVYVLIFDQRNKNKTIAQTTTNYAKNFEYSFVNIPCGYYIIAAGTDKNNDDVIGNSEEDYIGYYPLFSSRKEIYIRANATNYNIDFDIFSKNNTAGFSILK